MTLQQVEYVLVLAEEKSFSKAAKRLFITQPSLSQVIKNIENQIGSPLFDRSINPIQLTEVGKVFIETAKKIQIANIELDNKIADLSNLKLGACTIGTSVFCASCMLPKSMAEFSKRFPGIKLNMVTDQIDVLKHKLLTGEIDICIDSSSFDLNLYHEEILFEENFYLAVPKDHPFNIGKEEYMLNENDIVKDSAHLYDVKEIELPKGMKYNFTLLKPGNSIYNRAIEICKDLGIEFNKLLYANQVETAFYWAWSGLAMTLIPDTLIKFGNYKEHPVYYKLPTDKTHQNIVAVSKKNRYLSRAVKEYILVLQQLIGQGTWYTS